MFKLEFETDNAAFAHDVTPEIARILEMLSLHLTNMPLDGAASRPLYDINGNTVGRWEFTP